MCTILAFVRTQLDSLNLDLGRLLAASTFTFLNHVQMYKQHIISTLGLCLGLALAACQQEGLTPPPFTVK